jgi:hypothetical protein
MIVDTLSAQQCPILEAPVEKKQQVEKTLSRDEASAKRVQYGTDRRGFLTGLTGAAAFLALDSVIARADVTSSPVTSRALLPHQLPDLEARTSLPP